jgi:hypothetical protein
MPKATTKKLGPWVQRVVWQKSETTRGIISRSVKVKHKSSLLRPSSAEPSTSQHATPMNIDFDFDPSLMVVMEVWMLTRHSGHPINGKSTFYARRKNEPGV